MTDYAQEIIDNIIDAVKSNYAMGLFEGLPDDDTKKFIMTLIKNGCPARVILNTLIEFQKGEKK